MRKFTLLFALILASLSVNTLYAAEDTATTDAATTVAAPAEAEAPAAAETPAAAVETPAAEPEAVPAPEAAPGAEEAVEPAAGEVATNENLEFVSGEITKLDEAAKTVTVKLYGETEANAEKTLSIAIDDSTDITDGEKDRDLKSLAAGTEVDVEYDPATNKATYIFVY